MKRSYKPTEDARQGKARKNRKARIFCCLLLLALVLTIALLAGSQAAGYHYAQQGNYELAGKLLGFPRLTDCFDRNLTVYASASRSLSAGDYGAAADQFNALGAYLTAPQMKLEAEYQQAAAWLAAGETQKALHGFQLLEKEGYRDAQSRLEDARYQLFEECAAEENYLTALHTLQILKDQRDVTRELRETQENLYAQAVTLYRQGDAAAADARFNVLGDYLDSPKYRLLLDFKTRMVAYLGWEEVEQLWEMRDFEDAEKVLLEPRALLRILLGSWKDKDGKFIYEMYEDLGYYTNLYDIGYGDHSFWEDGKLKFYPTGNHKAVRSQWAVRILDLNTIQVLCYKYGIIITLYRQ